MRELSQLIILEAKDGYLIKLPKGTDGKIEIELLSGNTSERCKMGKSHNVVEAVLEDFIEPVTFDEDTDSTFRKHYKEMFCGKYDFGERYISQVSIHPGFISINIDDCSGCEDIFYLSPAKPESHLELAFKAPNINGVTETYTISMGVSRSRIPGEFYGETIVKEPRGADGERSIVLERGNWLKKIGEEFGLDSDSWILAHVIENR